MTTVEATNPYARLQFPGGHYIAHGTCSPTLYWPVYPVACPHMMLTLAVKFTVVLFFWLIYPICSMYGILTYIWVIFRTNVGKYSIHGASGYCHSSSRTVHQPNQRFSSLDIVYFVKGLVASDATPRCRFSMDVSYLNDLYIGKLTILNCIYHTPFCKLT